MDSKEQLKNPSLRRLTLGIPPAGGISLPQWHSNKSAPTRFICCSCQSMVIGTSSRLTRIPNLRYSEEGNLIQCKQLNCDRLQLWNSSVALQLNYRCKAGYRVGSGDFVWILLSPHYVLFVLLRRYPPWDDRKPVCHSGTNALKKGVQKEQISAN